MSESPFESPDDIERTVIRPRPGGSRAAMRVAPPPEGDGGLGAVPETVATGNGPLLAAASPVLQLLARLPAMRPPTDPAFVRDHAQRELRTFERRAHAAGVPAEHIRMAHAALCAALDDVALHVLGERPGSWGGMPLSVALHQDRDAGAGFFTQLRAVRGALPGEMPVMEVMFVCLSLGMMGPYRGTPEGEAQMDQVRHQVFGLIGEAAGPSGAPLSTDVQALVLPTRRRRVPLWVVASAALAGVAAVFLGCRMSLTAASDALYRAALASPPSAMPAFVKPNATLRSQ